MHGQEKCGKPILPFADVQHGKHIVFAVRALAEMPNFQNVKDLTNHVHQYRLRVGYYRVFFNLDGVVRIVSIQEEKERDERTYQNPNH
ncbi:MAG TPA: type II toxin-antitoxin system RelE/ParE family toxin [Noviherbaspirillum sp.]|uniref:type II toxin-antitoxin system RelE family toxin n=1 Tax=Noviherbaspirillum sp. TaxID=1926288 RepID=UPI002F9356FF